MSSEDSVSDPPTASGPDADSRARTHLANERTFLAWFRTGLTMIALGIAAAQFLGADPVGALPFVRGIATLLAIGGVLVAAGGSYRYSSSRTRIESVDFRPARLSVVLTTVAAAIIGILAVAFIWFVTSG